MITEKFEMVLLSQKPVGQVYPQRRLYPLLSNYQLYVTLLLTADLNWSGPSLLAEHRVRNIMRRDTVYYMY